MSKTFTCDLCRDPFEVPGDEFTHVSVSFHNQDRENFAVSVCEPCGEQVVELAAEANERKVTA